MEVKVRVLDPQEVENLEGSSRTMRGGYLVHLQRFVESGDMAWDFSSIFTHKSPEAIRSSLNNNIDKHARELKWPKLKVMIDNHTNPENPHCVVINMTLHSGQAVGEAEVEEEITLV